MAITFSHIFESLNHCRNESRVLIDPDSKTYPIQVEDPWLYGSRSMRYFSNGLHIPNEKDTHLNQKTNDFFIQCVQEFAGKNVNKKEIQSLIHRIKEKKNKPLTAAKVRSTYKTCIASFLEGYRKIAVLARDNDRIIITTNSKGKSRFRVRNVDIGEEWFNRVIEEENRRAVQVFKDSMIAEWGERRVSRAAARHRISFDHMIKKGTPLKASHVNRMIIGVADYYLNDLINCWHNLRKIIKKEKPLSILPQRTLSLLCKELNTNVLDEEGIIQSLQQILGDVDNLSFAHLDQRILSLLKRITLLEAKELELAFQGRRIEGIVDGLHAHFSSFFIHYPDVHDLERLQMYHMILTAKERINDEQLESFYDEILTKGIVKKEELKDGMLIPTPWEDHKEGLQTPGFYMIRRLLVTGYAKLGYQLTPLSSHLKKDYLMFRSTSSAPSSMDSLTTIITDLFPWDPPGYLWRYAGDDTEKKIITDSKRPLRVVGHSLGGSHSQLALLNRIQNDKDLPEREFEIVTFDSPKIKLECAEEFAKWLNTEAGKKMHGKISITHYLSDNDIIPFSGEALLGAEVKPHVLKSLKVVKLIPTASLHPQLNSNPHGRHFFRTEKNKDFKEEELPINDTTCRKWHVIEVIRKIVGCILFPLLWLYNAIKVLIFGIGHSLEEEASKVWRKFYPPSPVAGTD